MAKITTEQARNLKTNNGGGFFSLKNDNDKARVKFLYKKTSDIETYAVHEVKVGNFTKHVDCLKDADGNGNCPFCEKGFKLTARTFFKMYNVDKDAAEVWDCSLKRASGIENMLSMSRANEIANDCFEIIRHGVTGAKDTTYDVKYVGSDDVCVADLPEAPEIYGKFVWKKTAEEMEYYITHNEFPKKDEQKPSDVQNTEVKKRVNRMAF